MPIILDGANGIITPSTTSSGDVIISDKIVHSDDTNTAIRFPAADTITVETAGSERLRIDSAGNVGIGVTPSSGSLTHLEIGAVGNAISGYPADAAIYMTSNAVFASGWKYAQTGKLATRYAGEAGQHQFFTAPSGTAGGAITFSERMRIDSAGNVGIGESSPAGKFHARFDAGAGDGHTAKYIFQSIDQRLTIGTYYEAGVAQNSRIQSSSASGVVAPLLLNPDGGNIFIGSTGVSIGATARVTIDAGTTNATTYNTLAARGGSRMYIQQQQTTSVSTTATVICTPGLYAGLCLIHGSDGTNRFQDLVMMSIGTGNVSVINSFSVSGTPASRTYSQTSSTYRLAMASGTYTVQFTAITMSS